MARAGFYRRTAATALLLLAATAMAGSAGAEPIRIRSTSIPLSTSDPDERRVGDLVYMGGLSLRSPAEAFGGLSGLHISSDGKRMLAISDMGSWLQADLVHDENGALADVRNARLAPMLGTDGKPVAGKRLGDAEGLFVAADGIYVSFERRHRIWRYPLTDDLSGAVPVPLPAPEGIGSIRNNKGLEALTGLPGGALLLLTEESLDDEGRIRGWLRAADGGSYAPLRLRRDAPFAVTAAALLPEEDAILILERRFSTLGGLGIKLRRIPVSSVEPGALLGGKDVAEFAPPHNIDNFEGLAIRPDEEGHRNVYLLSDDNFNGFQRTLLLHFRLAKAETAERP